MVRNLQRRIREKEARKHKKTDTHETLEEEEDMVSGNKFPHHKRNHGQTMQSKN